VLRVYFAVYICHFTKTVFQGATNLGDCVNGTTVYNGLFRIAPFYETCLSWLIEHIRIKGSNSKKTIIYCRSIDTVSEICCTLKDCLGKMAYVDGKIDSQHILLEMYQKSTHQDSKDRIINEFKKCDSHIRCIVATVALGMWLDIRDVDLVLTKESMLLTSATFFIENFTANAVSVAIGDNRNRLIFEIWWNFFYDLFSMKNVAVATMHLM
jgi:hypothetical protein